MSMDSNVLRSSSVNPSRRHPVTNGGWLNEREPHLWMIPYNVGISIRTGISSPLACYNPVMPETNAGEPPNQPRPIEYASPVPDSPKGAMRTLFFIAMMDIVGFGIIIPLLPFYIPGYNEGTLKQTLEVTLLFSIYSICQFIGAPVLGLMSDRFGRRPVLALSQVGSAIGYLLLGVATQPWFGWSPATMLTLVYISRMLDGFTGGNVSTAQAYISDITTPKTRTSGMGMLGAAFGIGFVLGPMIGGMLGSVRLHGRDFVALPAYAAMAMSLGAALATWRYLPRREPKAADGCRGLAASGAVRPDPAQSGAGSTAGDLVFQHGLVRDDGIDGDDLFQRRFWLEQVSDQPVFLLPGGGDHLRAGRVNWPAEQTLGRMAAGHRRPGAGRAGDGRLHPGGDLAL